MVELNEFLVPSRGLISFRGEFVRITRGEGIMSHSFHEYKPKAGDFETRRNESLLHSKRVSLHLCSKKC